MNKDIEIIKKIEEVFPKRPMKVNKLNERSMIGIAVVAFLFSLFGIKIFIPDIYPELTTDYKISQNPIKVDGNIRGECRVVGSPSISTHCSVTISYKNHNIKRKFSFFGYHEIQFNDSDKWRDKVSIIASADDPSLVTINLAIDKLMNRFLLSMSDILIFVMLFFSGIFMIYAAWPIIKIINQINGQKLKPVLVPIVLSESAKYFFAGYKIKDSPDKMIKFRYMAIFTSKSGGPIIISQEKHGEVNALGIISETETLPVLLDKQFKRCDFTEQEIQELTNCLSLVNKKN